MPAVDVFGEVQQLFTYQFMVNALLAGTIVAVVAGVVGWFMVLRGQSFAGHTLSQVGFPGAAGAALVGATPAAGLLVFCVLAALGIAVLGDRRSVERRAEAAGIGSILAFALALGYLFATLYSGFVGGVQAFLFGTFLGITQTQVLLLLIASLVVLGAMAVMARPLLWASIDPDAAAARGVPVRALSIIFLIVLGVGVAEAAQITGTLLVFALLVAPAATAQQLSARPPVALALSVVIGLLVAWVGMAVAYWTGYPVGFWVTSAAMALYLLARGARFAVHLRGRRDQRALAQAA
jgi:zinc/manganese transport system permease protein